MKKIAGDPPDSRIVRNLRIKKLYYRENIY